MKEYNFLPMWYRNKIDRKEKIRFIVVLSIIIILLVINILRIVRYRKDIKATNNKINNINLQNLKYKKVRDSNKINKQFSISTYYDLRKVINTGENFSDIDITKHKIFMQKKFNSMEEAARTLDNIKSNFKYEIKDIKIEELENEKILLKVELKAGKNE
ncbi:conserved hypothetical protein [Clostridium botulinum C str. Eklund]|nr:conserved hypothetical protein [Clostridium botulinum C str. Eklund]NEZ50113.1 hypothetical protein [Clostridium botulinum]